MKALLQEVRALDAGRKTLRSFGLVVGGVFAALALVLFWRNAWETTLLIQVIGGGGAVLMVLGALVPAVLKPVYYVWMGLAVVLGFVMTHVILTLTYYLLFTPIGLIMRVLGKDPMARRLEPKAASYWIKKTYVDPTPQRLEKYF